MTAVSTIKAYKTIKLSNKIFILKYPQCCSVEYLPRQSLSLAAELLHGSVLASNANICRAITVIFKAGI